jgi:uncharacterized membrane protein (UPF0127 family)
MRTGRLYRLEGSAPVLLMDAVMYTQSMLERMRGLLGRNPLQPEQGLIIDRCRSVHTCGMNYALDLVFLDQRWTIQKLVRHIRPWRMAGCFAAQHTLELQAGRIDSLNLKMGMQLLWQEITAG